MFREREGREWSGDVTRQTYLRENLPQRSGTFQKKAQAPMGGGAGCPSVNRSSVSIPGLGGIAEADLAAQSGPNLAVWGLDQHLPGGHPRDHSGPESPAHGPQFRGHPRDQASVWTEFGRSRAPEGNHGHTPGGHQLLGRRGKGLRHPRPLSLPGDGRTEVAQPFWRPWPGSRPGPGQQGASEPP